MPFAIRALIFISVKSVLSSFFASWTLLFESDKAALASRKDLARLMPL